ncbi:hypothetical protein CVT23_03740 [Minwuia thermotolerans]|uniref:Uncharacterized protein n=1 Tax=Minwuia thermotolerans TaxID=2056226 RepID=A0A2M9G5J0_9PROT|nr:hypothetical protein CVT23_03740 [Minwuia thermotolerans]
MITDSDRYSYQKSTYERPTFPYVCGRACSFGQPCPNGPNFDGSCGGTTECTPFRNGDRWECRRSPSAGGPCADGPMPDGTCCMQHPPCTPQPSLRRRRFRISTLVAILVVAAIFAVLRFEPSAFQGDQANLSSLMPGPLSRAHSNFALEETGCTSCHEAHGKGVIAWAEAFVTHQTVGESCTDCHAFGGPATTAHNAVFDGGGGFATDSPSAETRTDCVMCHTEHKGKDANIAPMKDAQCNSCHQSTVSSFSRDHPAFAAGFPHDRRGSIQFNHVNHFSQYFPKELAEDKQPTCVTCHDVQRAGLDVPPGSFEQNCASCHLEGITDRSLRLITLPYLEEDPFDMDQVAEVCGPTPDQVEFLRARAEGGDPDEVEFDEYFYEDWGDYLSPPMALMLGAPPDDNYEYNEPVGEFFMALAESGLEPMVERLEAVPGDARPERLLAGLDGELLRRAACAWMQKMEYEAPSELTGGGWQSEGVSVSYRPTGHADPIARAWFDFAVNAPRAAEAAGADEIVIEQAELLQTTLLGDTGLGNCAKCHAVTEVTDKSGEGGEDAAKLMVEWGYQPVEDRPYVQYDHGPHVNLLGPGTLCATCHKLNPEADYAASFKHFDATDFAPGFKPIGKETCTQCHTEAKVRQDCQLCHEYHLEPGFIRTMGFQQTAQEPERPGQDGG